MEIAVKVLDSPVIALDLNAFAMSRMKTFVSFLVSKA